MSYDYDFFRVGAEVRSPNDLTDENTQPIGTVQEVCAILNAAFPSALLDDSGGWLDAEAAIGDVQFYDPSLISFSISRVDVAAVRMVCCALGVVALDGQEMKLIRATESDE